MMLSRLQFETRQSSRHAFTLVELLVVMSIMILLATLTISGFRSSFDADRVGQAASGLRGAIEGARSRAIKANAQRGLRLLLDPRDNRTVTSMVYIGAPEVITGRLRVEFDNRNSGSTGDQASSFGHWRVFDVGSVFDTQNFVNWRNLFKIGVLRPGCKIKFGGTEYTLVYRSTTGSAVAGEDDAWVITPDYPYADVLTGTPPSGFPENALLGRRPTEPELSEVNSSATPIGLESAVASIPYDYELTLLPSVLDGAAPVPFPPNTCIDLDGSKIPTSWRPNGLNRPYGPRYEVTPGNYEVRPIDIMFTPRGALTQSLVGEGFFHFRVAHQGDLLLARGFLGGVLPNNGTDPIVIKDPERPAKLVTLVTRTGILRISDVAGEGDTSTPQLFNDEYFTSADVNPYAYAIRGREAKR